MFSSAPFTVLNLKSVCANERYHRLICCHLNSLIAYYRALGRFQGLIQQISQACPSRRGLSEYNTETLTVNHNVCNVWREPGSLDVKDRALYPLQMSFPPNHLFILYQWQWKVVDQAVPFANSSICITEDVLLNVHQIFAILQSINQSIN